MFVMTGRFAVVLHYIVCEFTGGGRNTLYFLNQMEEYLIPPQLNNSFLLHFEEFVSEIDIQIVYNVEK